MTTLADLAAAATPGPWDPGTEGDEQDTLVVQLPEDLSQRPVAVCDRWQTARLIALTPELAAIAIAAENLCRPLRNGDKWEWDLTPLRDALAALHARLQP